MVEKMKVEVCVGTTCFVLGASSLQDLSDFLEPEIAEKVDIVGATCLGLCRNKNFGNSPFVRINGTRIVSQATVDSVITAIKEELAKLK